MMKFVISVGVILLFFALSTEVFAECTHAKPQWYLHFGLRDVPNSLRYNQGGRPTQSEIEQIPMHNDIDVRNSEDNTNEEVKNSPLPLVLIGQRYYYFGTYFKTNYFKALQFCEDHGMSLLSIESKTENDEIIKYLKQKYAKIDHVWTSGTDLGLEGEFVWLSTGKLLNFTYWSPPQPDNAGKIEHCLEIWKLGDGNYIWNDIVCANQYNFICELKECSNFCTNSR